MDDEWLQQGRQYNFEWPGFIDMTFNQARSIKRLAISMEKDTVLRPDSSKAQGQQHKDRENNRMEISKKGIWAECAVEKIIREKK